MTKMLGNVALVMLTVLLLQLLLATAWLLGSWVLDLPKASARHWCASALLVALALAMVLLRGDALSALNVALSNVVMVAAVLALLRGMQLFLLRRPHDAEALAVLLLAIASSAVVLALPEPWNGRLQASSTSALLLWLFGRAAGQAARALRAEFNAGVALLLVAPLLVAATMAGLRLGAAWLGTARPIQVDTPLHVALALVLVMVTLSVHGAMAAMVVLRLVTRLRRLSQRDPLTGLLNRAEWTRQLRAQHRWLGRYGDGFAVLMIDIDHFKRINDAWGHAAGDAVLVAVAQTLLAAARQLDAVGRLGGEEFALLLPRTGAEDALATAERLRRQLSDMVIAWKQQPLQLSVSIGVAGADDADEPPEQVLERADQALYRAKRAGRDRVELAAGQLPAQQALPGFSAAG